MLAFFSYSHIDAESEGPLVSEIQTELEKKTRAAWGKRSFEIWRDMHNLRWGVTWAQAIEEAIASCDLFVLLLSPGWLQSPYCRQEFEAFKARERALGTGERILIAQILDVPKALLDSDEQSRELFDELGTRQRKMWMTLANSVEFDRMKMYREAASEMAALLFAIKSPEKSRELVAKEELVATADGGGIAVGAPPPPVPPPPSAAAAPGGEARPPGPGADFAVADTPLVAVGSQLVSFSPGFPKELRTAISESFLLAQLAANSADPERKGDTKDWVTKLVSVLANLGWRILGESEVAFSVDHTREDARKQLQDILLLLSPAETHEQVQALFRRALEGPARDGSEREWSQLFERQTRVIDGARFQIAHVSQREGGAVELNLLAVQISGQIESTGVLFFRWQGLSRGMIEVQRFQLALEEEVFNSVKDVVAQRVAAYALDYIAALEM